MPTGLGGDGGDVYFYADIVDPAGGGTLYNAGAIDTTGGDGDGGGGDGGYVGAWLDGPAAGDGVASSNAYNLAGIDTRGGKATGANGSGGDGGDIWMGIYAEGGSLNVLGVKKIDATGGDGAEGGGSRRRRVLLQ